jgi:predicted DNA-binding ArsR family transcriptional regulator
MALIALPLAFSARAQWIVYDPTVNIEQIISEAENIAQFVSMVDNQVQQIQQLTSQLEQLQQYNRAFGDPSQILNITGVSALTSDLTQTPLGQTISAVEQTSDGVAALTYNANGLYHQIGASFSTPSGNQIQRGTNNYKPYEAINNATANYTNVTANVLQRRQALKDAIASTTEALQSATTASEVQKLTGVLIGQNAALAATDKEVDQAVAVSVVQDIENRNDAQKQAASDQEEQKAEVIEAFSNYRTNFQLNTQPPVFPTDSR